MILRELWEFFKRNLLVVVLAVTLVVAMPWTLIFVLPVAIIVMVLLFALWRIRRAQQRIYDEMRRQAGEQYEEPQSQRSWWRKGDSEGEVTVVRTEPTEQRVNDEVGEYVDFKEVKNKETQE